MHGYYDVQVKMAKYSFKSLRLVLCLDIILNPRSFQEILGFAMCKWLCYSYYIMGNDLCLFLGT